MSSSSETGSSQHRRSTRKLRKPTMKKDQDPELNEHQALCRATDTVLQKIITTDEHFASLPPDCTLEELQSENSLARGTATTIYVKRDGLSTLKVVLPQQNPTIANLKRAIERTANLLQKRKIPPTASHRSISSSDPVKPSKSSADTPPRRRNTCGDLVAAPATGRKHRNNASWRFLWRAYALCKTQDIEQTALNPLPDANGRQLLSDFDIVHKSVLRFVKRENYFGRQRQR